MLTLFELQKKFTENLKNQDMEIYSFIQHNKHMSPKKQLAIYQDSILSAMQQALTRIYPVCKKLVGEAFFNYIINHYIIIHPSFSPDLNNYGAGFSEYLKDIETMATLCYLADVANFEWSWHSLYQQITDKKFDFDKLRFYENQAKNIIFKLPRSAILLQSIYPIYHIFLINQKENEDDQSIFLQPNQQYFYIIWRNDLGRQISSLNKVEWIILTWMQDKLSLGEMSEKLMDLNHEINLNIIIPQMICCGFIVDIAINN